MATASMVLDFFQGPLKQLTVVRLSVFLLCSPFGVLSADLATLRLVNEFGGRRFDRVVAVENQLRVIDGAENREPNGASRWKIEGDLPKNASYFHFSPNYRVDVLPASAGEAGRTLTVANVFVSRVFPWREQDLEGGVLVVAWLLDGAPAIVRPVPVPKEKKASAGQMVIVPVLLPPRMERGAPVVLLFKNGSFLAPAPMFSNAAARRFLGAVFLGPPEEYASALSGLRPINITDRFRATLLQHLTEGGFKPAVSALLERKAFRSNEDESGNTPLHAAASKGRKEIVDMFVADRAPIFRRNDGRTPFQLALERGHVSSALSLIPSKDWSREAEQLLAVALNQGNSGVVKQLLARPGATLPKGASPQWMARALSLRDPELTAELLEAGIPANAEIRGAPLLSLAVLTSDPESVGVLLKGGADVNRSGLGGRTALHEAVFASKPEIARQLIQAGAKIDSVDRQGRTPLALAAIFQNRTMIRWLSQAGARLTTRDLTDRTILSGLLATDEISLLQAGAETGWDPAATVAGQSWQPRQLAEVIGSPRTQAWFQGFSSKQADLDLVEAPDLPPKRVGEQEAVMISSPSPVEGVVGLKGIVNAQGQLVVVAVSESTDEVVAAVLRATATWRFQPAIHLGKPVPARVSLAVPFVGDSRIYLPEELEVQTDVVARTPVQPSRVARGRLRIDQMTVPAISDTRDADGRVTSTSYGASTSSIRSVDSVDSVAVDNEWAVVTAVVERDGTPSDPQLVGAANDDFAEATMRAFQKYRFKPGVRHAKPVRSRVVAVINSTE